MKRTYVLAALVAVLVMALFAADAMAMYHPTMGRFLQRDPERYADSASLYQYCVANPTRYADPSGLRKRKVEEAWLTDEVSAGLKVPLPHGKLSVLIRLYEQQVVGGCRMEVQYKKKEACPCLELAAIQFIRNATVGPGGEPTYDYVDPEDRNQEVAEDGWYVDTVDEGPGAHDPYCYRGTGRGELRDNDNPQMALAPDRRTETWQQFVTCILCAKAVLPNEKGKYYGCYGWGWYAIGRGGETYKLFDPFLIAPERVKASSTFSQVVKKWNRIEEHQILW